MAGEFPCLRGTQGMVPVASGGDRCGTLYGSQTDEVAGATGARRGHRMPYNGPLPPAAPNALWVADLTCVATSQGLLGSPLSSMPGHDVSLAGVSKHLGADRALQALAAREVGARSLIHHRDRGVQYVSRRGSERLSQAGITPSLGRVGDAYDNALAETVIGLYKTELIRRQKSWQTLETVEYATLARVDWFNTPAAGKWRSTTGGERNLV